MNTQCSCKVRRERGRKVALASSGDTKIHASMMCYIASVHGLLDPDRMLGEMERGKNYKEETKAYEEEREKDGKRWKDAEQ